MTMTDASTIYSVDISLSTYQNAALANYTFMVSSIVPITERDYLVITFPPEIELPWDQKLKASFSTSTSLISSVEGDVVVKD